MSTQPKPNRNVLRIASSEQHGRRDFEPSLFHSVESRHDELMHVYFCLKDECEKCENLVDKKIIIACQDCHKIQHYDWLGWKRVKNEKDETQTFCPECHTT
jgi:hypothetical protein